MENEPSPVPETSKDEEKQSRRNWRGILESAPARGVDAANIAVERSRRPAALVGRSALGVIGAIALAGAVVLLYILTSDESTCANSDTWTETLGCQASVWGLLLLSGLVAAIALPGAALGIKGRRGLTALVINAPFLLLCVAGLGLLFGNLGPLGALLQHQDAGGFVLAVVLLALGLPVVAVLTLRQIRYARALQSEDTESLEEQAAPE